MGRVKCVLGNRGKPTAEWFKNGKPQYYCHGYIDRKTDDLLPECAACPDHVNKAEDDRAAWYGETAKVDLVPVVRCRDCENWAGDPATKPEYAGCWRYGAAHAILVHENGFCDKGKRRTDGAV